MAAKTTQYIDSHARLIFTDWRFLACMHAWLPDSGYIKGGHEECKGDLPDLAISLGKGRGMLMCHHNSEPHKDAAGGATSQEEAEADVFL